MYRSDRAVPDPGRSGAGCSACWVVPDDIRPGLSLGTRPTPPEWRLVPSRKTALCESDSSAAHSGLRRRKLSLAAFFVPGCFLISAIFRCCHNVGMLYRYKCSGFLNRAPTVVCYVDCTLFLLICRRCEMMMFWDGEVLPNIVVFSRLICWTPRF